MANTLASLRGDYIWCSYGPTRCKLPGLYIGLHIHHLSPRPPEVAQHSCAIGLATTGCLNGAPMRERLRPGIGRREQLQTESGSLCPDALWCLVRSCLYARSGPRRFRWGRELEVNMFAKVRIMVAAMRATCTHAIESVQVARGTASGCPGSTCTRAVRSLDSGRTPDGVTRAQTHAHSEHHPRRGL